MKIGLIGDGATSTSIEFALQQSEISVTPISIESVSKSKLKAFSIVLVVDNVGSPLFEKVNDDITTSWIAIELGGLGGYSIPPVLGSISLFNPATACYSCLRDRVKSNLSTSEELNPKSIIPISPSFESLLGSLSAYIVNSVLNSDMTHSHVFEISDLSIEHISGGNSAITHRLLLPVPTCSSNDHSSTTHILSLIHISEPTRPY